MAVFSFTGYGNLDSGGQALPSEAPQGIVIATLATLVTTNFVPFASRGPTDNGLLYTGGSGGQTTGFGQIFPTGRS